MYHDEVQRQIERLESTDPMERLRGVHALGKLGVEPQEPSQVLEVSVYSSAVRRLAKTLDDPASPLIRAETAWVLGQIGGLAATRRLLYRLADVLPAPGAGRTVLTVKPDQDSAPEHPDVLANLIAAIGRSLSPETLEELDQEELDNLREGQQILLQRLPTETDQNLRVALIETLVALAVNAERAGVDLDTDLTPLLCSQGSTAVLAAIALLKETVPAAPLVARRWHSCSGPREPDSETNALLEGWQQLLGPCDPGHETLLEWLDAAAILWDLGEAAQAP